MPMFAWILTFVNILVPTRIVQFAHESAVDQCEYTYSNIIGPTKETLLEEIQDIHFVVKGHNKEVIFNCISFKDDINIVLSFQEGVIQDKARFEECIYKAYEELIS
jgi:hypothetical protein